MTTTTKRWKVTLVLELEEGSQTTSQRQQRYLQCVQYHRSMNHLHHKDEDIIQYDFKLLDD